MTQLYPIIPKSSYTVLLIEDSAIDRQVYQRFLSKNSHFQLQVVEFDNGQEALQWCQNHVPDILLVDYFLPDMNGLEFLDTLRQQPNQQWIPGILITGQYHSDIAERAFQNDTQDFLDKNRITAEGLNRAINNVLQKSELQQQAQKERRDRQKIEQVINQIATRLVTEVNKDFFRVVVQHIAELLEVDCVSISEIINPQRGRTLAVCHQQQIVDNIEIDLTIAPCSLAIKTTGNTVTIYQDKAQQLFPENPFIQSDNIQSYLGIPLVNTAQETIGLFVVFHSHPLENTQLLEEILKIFAGRAGAELERRQMESKLRQSEADHREAQRVSHVGHWKWDKTTDEIWWSEEMYRIFGVPLNKKITFLSFIERIHLDDRVRVLAKIENALPGSAYFNTYRICRPNGSIRYTQVSAELIFDKQGDPVGMRGTTLDVTKLKQTEIKLQNWNLALEERVKERTQELSNLYLRLQNELEEKREIELAKEINEVFYSQFLEEELVKRKKAEKVLEQRENLLRGIGDNVPRGILYQIMRKLDGTYRFIYLSAGVERETGYKAEEVYQDASLLMNTIIEEDRPLLWWKYQESWENLSIFDLSVRVRSLQGEIRWIRLCSSPRRLEDGRTVWDGIRLDIHELKQTQEYLYKNQLLLSEAQQIARIGSWEVDLATQSQYWSDELFVVLNRDRAQGQTNSDNYLDLFHPDDRAILKQTVDQAMAFGTRYQLKLRIPLADGTIRHIESIGQGELNQNGEMIRLYGTIQDITERVQSEIALQESQNQLQRQLTEIEAIYQSAPIGLAVLDTDLCYVRINQRLAEINGLSIEEHIGRTVRELLPNLADTVEPLLLPILETGQPLLKVEIFGETPSQVGVQRVWLESFIPLKNGDRVIGINIVCEEITERYNLERIKGEILSIASHELRTPLTSIQAGLSLFQSQVIDSTSPEGEATIEIMADSVDHLVRLVNDIFDLERLRSGKLGLEKSYCDVQPIIQQAIAQLQALAQQKEIQIKVSSPPFLIYADKDRILQVLINLLSNAIKFSLPAGQIELSVESLISQTDEDSLPIPWVKFSIRDRGRGIPTQHLESIFESFQQVDSSDAREKEGFGLGLSICRNIVESHGGQIWVESVVKQGSTFYFTIPAEPLDDLTDDTNTIHPKR